MIFEHVSITVSDLARSLRFYIEHVAKVSAEKLRRAAQPIGKPYWRMADVSDPDGVILELLER